MRAWRTRGKNGDWRRDSKSSSVRVVGAVSVSHSEIRGVPVFNENEGKEIFLGFVPFKCCKRGTCVSLLCHFFSSYTGAACYTVWISNHESFTQAALAFIFNERLLHFINRPLKNSNRIDPC